MTDAIVVGAGLSGLVAACEVAAAGRHVTVLDQEPEQSLGGQAHWSFGGLFFIDSPEQRRFRIRDSLELARQDWLGAAGFDRPEDHWPRQWAEAYLQFAAGEKRAWLHSMGVRWFPIVGWAERGRNSVPRFHVTWGTGPGLLAPFIARARQAEQQGPARVPVPASGRRVAGRTRRRGRSSWLPARGEQVERGVKSSREVVGDFELRAPAVIIASGGIGGNHDLVRRHWPTAMGAAPHSMVCGVPASTDGSRARDSRPRWRSGRSIATACGTTPKACGTGIQCGPITESASCPGRPRYGSMPTACASLPRSFPGSTRSRRCVTSVRTGSDYSWFILNQHIIRKEFALSGSEQNPDLTGKSIRLVLGRAIGKRAVAPVESV